MKKFFVSLIVLILVCFLLLQIDDPLDKEVLEWVESVDYQTPNDSYYYLLGLNVSADQDPLEFGKAKVKEMREWEKEIKSNGYLANEKVNQFSIEPEESLLDLDNKFSLNSYEDYFNAFNAKDFNQSLDYEQHLFLSRFHHWLNFQPYRSMEWKFSGARFPTYPELLSGFRLNLYSLCSQFSTNKKIVAKQTEENIYQIVALVEDANYLLDRVIFMLALNYYLDAYALMAQKDPNSVSRLEIDWQRLVNIEKVLKGELAFSFNSVEIIEQNQEYVNPFISDLSKFEAVNLLPNWLGRTFYKPNMALNHSLSLSKFLLINSTLTPSDYYRFSDNICNDFDESSLLDRVRNLGLLPHYGACYFFDNYLARGYDFIAKVTLINTITDQKEQWNTSQTINPATSEADSFYDKQKNRVCFKTLERSDVAKKKGLSCIYKLSPEV